MAGERITLRISRAAPPPCADPLPCTCGAMPVKETRIKSLGKVSDGGFDVTQGRYKCPECGNAPGWGKCYCVDYGWDKSTEVWNRHVRGTEDDEAAES